jgi:hypothetical protein
VHPRSPEVPLGVFTVTLAVPGTVIKVIGIIACTSCALVMVVLKVVPLMTTTEDETK